MWVVGQDEHRCLKWRLLAPPAPPPIAGPIASLRAELAASHYLGADALAPHAGQGAVHRDGGIGLVDPVDNPAIEPAEEPLRTADRSLERHMLASGVAVEGDIHVVHPGPGHRDSFRDRTDRIPPNGGGSARSLGQADLRAVCREHWPSLGPGVLGLDRA